jgi:hypothetical protein
MQSMWKQNQPPAKSATFDLQTLLTLMRIQIRLFTLKRIRIRLLKMIRLHADPDLDLQHCTHTCSLLKPYNTEGYTVMKTHLLAVEAIYYVRKILQN